MKSGKPSLTVAEACLIISLSAKEGVSVLKFRGLQVEFGTLSKDRPEPPSSPSPWKPGVIPSAAMEVPPHEEQAKEAAELDELRLREEQIEELLLTDPFKAEELIRDGDLEEMNGPFDSDD